MANSIVEEKSLELVIGEAVFVYVSLDTQESIARNALQLISKLVFYAILEVRGDRYPKSLLF